MNRLLLASLLFVCCGVIATIAIVLTRQDDETSRSSTNQTTDDDPFGDDPIMDDDWPIPNNQTVDFSLEFRNQITDDRLYHHCEQFQAIADENDGVRSAWTSGYEASVEYVVELLTEAGYAIHYSEITSDGRTDQSIHAETDFGDPSQTIVVGAHLDSVRQGPGLQDNISGSAALLELALQLKKNGWDNSTVLKHKIQFSWWAAEEIGLVGSSHYVQDLSPQELGQIAMYLNVDMIGSPNFVRFVLDGDGSNSEFQPIPEPGSPMAHMEATLLQYFQDTGLPVAQEPFANSYQLTDHTAFYDAGIPVSDLHTGTNSLKSESEAAIFGGTAGEPWDPCYHQECDDIDNINVGVMGEMARAAAHFLAVYGAKQGDVWA